MVTDYKRQCRYEVGTLKDFIYLIPYEVNRLSYSIDDGDCKGLRINDTTNIIKVEGFQAQLRNTESTDGRLKYESEVSIYVHEQFGKNLHNKMSELIGNRYFVVVEDKMGNQFIQSVEFYSEFEYGISLTSQNNAQNRTQLRFRGASNFPTMLLEEKIDDTKTYALFSNGCQYDDGGIYDLKMCESKYVIIHATDNEIMKIDSTGGRSFRNIDCLPKSLTYTQNYANGQFEDTITFSIPLNEYKHYFSNGLVEFSDNRYVATFRTAADNLYAVGYSDGASVSYVIETSTAVNALNKITITLKYIGSEGVVTSSRKDNDIFNEDVTEILRPAPDNVMGVQTKECQNNGKAYITLIQKYTLSGVGLDEYLVLNGYRDRYPSSLNIVGTYSLTDDMGFPLIVDHPSCVGGLCGTKNGISNPYVFSVYSMRYTFGFTSKCEYSFTSVPSWLNVTKEGDTINMEVSGSVPLTSTDTTFFVVTSDGVQYPVIVRFSASGETTGWDVMPRSFTVSHDEQNIKAIYMGNVTEGDLEFSSDTLTLVGISNGNIIVKVPQNNSNEIKSHSFTITNKKNVEAITIEVRQSGINEDWRVVGGYFCEGGNKYTKMELFIGGKGTGVYKAGSLIETGSADCTQSMTRWVESGTICDGVNEYYMLKEQISNNGGQTWTDTGQQMRGSLKEERSEKCDPQHVQWKNTGNHICDNGFKCEVWAKYIDNVATGQTESRNCVKDTTECPTEYITKWEQTTRTQCVDRGNGICDSWYMDEEYISYDNGQTWESRGLFKVSDRMAQKDDEACGCPNHDTHKYERWLWDGKSFLCEDPEYNCTVAAIWETNGFKYSEYYKEGIWEDKTIKTIETPCDFKEKITSLSRFAMDCQELETVGELDCENVTVIASAFENCVSLTNMPLKNLGKVKNASKVFYNCKNLKGKYSIPMPSLMTAEEMFAYTEIESWDFGGAKLSAKPMNILKASKLKTLLGLDYINVQENTQYRSIWTSSYIVTLQIKNIGIDFSFTGMKNLSKESMLYMYNNAKSSVPMIWTCDNDNMRIWGSLPTTKSNITWNRIS